MAQTVKNLPAMWETWVQFLGWEDPLDDIVQETGIKTIPMEKKCKKAKWLSGEALQIAVKRRQAKSKGERERCKHLNAEFQRIARRDKKAFLSDQCKEIEENNRMGCSCLKHVNNPSRGQLRQEVPPLVAKS